MTSNQNQKTESSKAKENVNTHVEKLAMNLKDHQGFQPDYLLNKTLKIVHIKKFFKKKKKKDLLPGKWFSFIPSMVNS